MFDRCRYGLFIIALLPFALLPVAAQTAVQDTRLRIRVSLSKELGPGGALGRLLVLMTDAPQPQQTFCVGFVPGSTWIAAMEITHLAAGAAIEFDSDANAYPLPFSQAKLGTYQVMALLDVDHSYAYNGEGDLKSEVVKLETLNPADAKPIELTLSRVNPTPSSWLSFRVRG